MHSIITKHVSNANGRGQVLAKSSAAGKQRTISWDHAASTDRNHGNAAGTLALALGFKWHDGIVHHVLHDGRHRFMI